MAVQNLWIRQEGTRVLLLLGGKCVADMPWDAALNLAGAIVHQARKAEEIAKHELVIADAALLARMGLPVGVAVDPRIRQEARKESQYVKGPVGVGGLPPGTVVPAPAVKPAG